MVKEIMKKLDELRSILEHLRGCIFKIFFNHGEGNNKENSHIEGHSRAFSKMYFQSLLNHGEGNYEEISQI